MYNPIQIADGIYSVGCRDWDIRDFHGYSTYEGTTYNAWSGFLAVENKLNNHHSLNLTAFAASNRRGKSSPNTQEVYDLKGYQYNSYWGNQEGDKHNSRIKEQTAIRSGETSPFYPHTKPPQL